MPNAPTARQVETRRCTEAMRALFLSFRAFFEEELRGTGVTLPQLRMLKTIGEQDQASAAAIARTCGVTPQTLHAMLTRAVREGWIVRGTSDRNHRFVTASLTPRGESIVQSGTQLRERMEAELWRDVPIPTLTVVRKTLESGLLSLESHSREPNRSERHPKR